MGTFTGPRQHETMLSPRQSKALGALARKRCRVGLKAVGLFFATQTGNTEEVAGLIGSATGLEASDYDGEDFSDLDGMIVGCPTWNTGADEMRSGTTWDDYLETIKGYDLKGKTVAVFGCGDSQGYGDNFCDGIEELHDTFAAAGARWLVMLTRMATIFLNPKASAVASSLACHWTKTMRMTKV